MFVEHYDLTKDAAELARDVVKAAARDAGLKLPAKTKKTAKVKAVLELERKKEAKPKRRRTYPVFIWGTNIVVRSCADCLEIGAIVPIGEADLVSAPDVFHEYRMASHHWEQERTG